MSSSKRILLIIDPQRDFHECGSLSVPGADADSARIAEMILRSKDQISDIYVTLDSHHRNHISHAAFWHEKHPDGTANKTKQPHPFSTITYDDVIEGRYFPVDSSLTEHCKQYTRSLESKNRFKHTIFPEHCLIGSVGHAVVENIHSSLQEWSSHHHKDICYVMKGQNNLTEMYSAIEAEVPIRSDPGTCTNHTLLEQLMDADELIVCGQALSHCVQYTVRDILTHWKSDKKKIILLEDCTSSVGTPDSIASADEFLAEMRESITVCNAGDIFN